MRGEREREKRVPRRDRAAEIIRRRGKKGGKKGNWRKQKQEGEEKRRREKTWNKGKFRVWRQCALCIRVMSKRR